MYHVALRIHVQKRERNKEKKKQNEKKSKKVKKQNWALAWTADKSAPCANPRPTETDTLQGIVC